MLGIDPGTACGWAVVVDGRWVAAGVWDLKPRRHEGGGMRYLRARRYLREVIEEMGGLDAVAYEEVRRHAGTSAAHVYGGIVAVIAAECEEQGIPYQAVPVGTVKKRATGRGNAGKAEMVDAYERETGAVACSDDEADAYWIAVVCGEGL